jgi:3-dehydroquinate synthase
MPDARAGDATVRVAVGGGRDYAIAIGAGEIGRLAGRIGRTTGRALIVTDANVAPLLAAAVQRAVEPVFGTVEAVVLPPGETTKSWASVGAVVDRLAAGGHGRDSLVLALGGGVVGDVAGFAAACYMRGIDFVQIPTTLLAQVDSSVGGKTGINHPLGKNLVGAFHQPRLVAVDTATLATLPRRELVAGVAEIVKAAAIRDPAFLEWLEAHVEDVLALEETALVHAIRRSVEIKAAIVAADERETGVRAHLNLGHTFGHAIEHVAGYGAWLHGEAVGCGTVLAADLSLRTGRIDAERARRLEALVVRAGLPTGLGDLDPAALVEAMRLDKKAHAGRVRFVLLEGADGACLAEASDEDVLAVLRARRGPARTVPPTARGTA